MKARVKETGEIIEVEHTAYDVNGRVIWRYADIENAFLYTDGQLDFNLEENHKGSQIVPLPYEPDYWEKLHHQAAIAAMQGLISKEILDTPDSLSSHAIHYATTLVEKLKNETHFNK